MTYKTIAERIAEWLAPGNPAEPLYLHDTPDSDPDAITLPPLPTTLTALQCSGLPWLVSLGSLAKLRHLTQLDIAYCRSLTQLPPLTGMRHLVELHLISTIVTALPGLVHLRALTRFSVTECWRLRAIDLPLALTSLEITLCPKLAAIGHLPSGLTHLHILSCPVLTVTGVFPPALTSLHIGGSPVWADASALRALEDVYCEYTRTALPDVRPAQVRGNPFMSVEANLAVWRAYVAARHAADRRRVASALPPLALLYV
jgi:hypothetical protein